MRIQVITLFPQAFRPLVELGVTGRAVTSGQVRLETVDPRDFAQDRHRTVDDRPYGGGPGMVMAVEPLRSTIRAARKKAGDETKVGLLSPQGQVLDQAARVDVLDAQQPAPAAGAGLAVAGQRGNQRTEMQGTGGGGREPSDRAHRPSSFSRIPW